jgi:hypothetical protein
MVPPVILTPVIAVLGALGAIDGDGVTAWISAAAFTVGIVEGLVGEFFHLHGTSYQVGGFTLRNFMGGPPPVLPIAYSLAGALGLIGLYV